MEIRGYMGQSLIFGEAELTHVTREVFYENTIVYFGLALAVKLKL